jgi:hypothetical protein
MRGYPVIDALSGLVLDSMKYPTIEQFSVFSFQLPIEAIQLKTEN